MTMDFIVCLQLFEFLSVVKWLRKNFKEEKYRLTQQKVNQIMKIYWFLMLTVRVFRLLKGNIYSKTPDRSASVKIKHSSVTPVTLGSCG